MIKRIHVKTNLFIRNPYIYRVCFSKEPHANVERQYSNLLKTIRNRAQYTFGYSSLIVDTIELENRYDNRYMCYIIFQNELDVVQIKLSVNLQFSKIILYPKNLLFTIHEVVESNE